MHKDDTETPDEGRRETVGVLVLAGLEASKASAERWRTRFAPLRSTLQTRVSEGWRADLILLAGNLTERGSHADFVELRRQLDEVREAMGVKVSSPAIVAVPGRTDACRGGGTDTAAAILADHWVGDPELQGEYRHEPTGRWRVAVGCAFDPYTTWLRDLAPIQPNGLVVEGTIIPGEFRATLHRPGCSVTVLGFNTALQSLGHKCPRDVVIDPWRIEAVTRAPMPVGVVLAVSHASPSTLTEESRSALGKMMRREHVALFVSGCSGDGPVEVPRTVSVALLRDSADEADETDQDWFFTLDVEVGETEAVARIWRGERKDSTALESIGQAFSVQEVPRRGVGFPPRPVESYEAQRERLQTTALKVFASPAGAERLTRTTLRHRGELEDFVFDHFPKVHKRYWERMPYESGVRLLLDSVEPKELVSALSGSFPSTVERELKKAPTSDPDDSGGKLR